jgi:hypothetical protein
LGYPDRKNGLGVQDVGQSRSIGILFRNQLEHAATTSNEFKSGSARKTQITEKNGFVAAQKLQEILLSHWNDALLKELSAELQALWDLMQNCQIWGVHTSKLGNLKFILVANHTPNRVFCSFCADFRINEAQD